MKKLIFEAAEDSFFKSQWIKKEYSSWVRIGFWRWLWMALDGGWVIRSQWRKNPPNKGEALGRYNVLDKV